jgi:D-glycero-D-manno-heptose 1,7-bisphosphate phosphatase
MKLLFVDLDGTIREPISDNTFIQHPKDQQPIPGVIEAIAKYRRDGWTIVGITNQGGVAAGYKTLESAIAEQKYTLEIFPKLFRIYFCPDNGECAYRVARSSYSKVERGLFDSFRKPGCGMIDLALSDFLKAGMSENSQYLMVGDRPEDQQCAEKAQISFLWAKDWRNGQ